MQKVLEFFKVLLSLIIIIFSFIMFGFAGFLHMVGNILKAIGYLILLEKEKAKRQMEGLL